MEKNPGDINLVLGASGYGKSSYIFDNLIKNAIENPDKNYIVVVPEQFTMSTQKEIVARHPNHGVLNIDIVSFNRLAFRVFEELGISGLTVLDDTGKSLILKRVIEENKDKLTIYKNKVNQTGFVEEMKSAISELYSYGIDLERFESIGDMAKERPYISDKLKDIQIIYGEFKKSLGDRYITKEEITEKLCNLIGSSGIIGKSQFVFDGFTGFTPIQYKLIGNLIECGRHITIAVTISSAEAVKLTDMGFSEIKEQELFNISKTTINKLFSVAADKQVRITKSNVVIMPDSSNYRHKNNGELDFLEKNIFRNNDKKYENSGKVKVLALENPLGEAGFVAAYINDAVRMKSFRYRDFAVITGTLDTYRELIANVFDENEIPFFMDNKRRLILNPCVAAIRSALEMVGDDFSYESVFKFLRCNMTGIDINDVDILENYVLEYGIRGYRSYEKPFTKVKSKRKANNMEGINAIRQQFATLAADFRISVMGKGRTVRELTLAVYQLMERLDFYRILKEYEDKFNEEGNLSLSKEYHQTYGLIIELLDKLVELMGDTKITVREYGKLLDAGFEEIKVGVIPLGVDSVVIGDIERTRLADIKVLFVMGVNDGIIPKTGGKTGLLTQRDRGYLKRLNVELSPDSRESIFIQRFYLYQNLTKPSDSLVLTYSLSTGEGRSARPSYLAGNVINMYEDKVLLTENPLQANVFTKEMGLKYVAGHFVNLDSQVSQLTKELYTYFFRDDSLKEKLMKVVEGAYFSTNSRRIDRAVANQLYSDEVVKSATRLEKYAACAYAHFLAYGLKLAERKVYEINAADIGTVYHEVIELFSKEMKARGLDFRTITDKDRDMILDVCVEKAGSGQSGDIFLSSRRNEYLLNRIKQVSSKTIWAISEHIKAGNFEPEDFELSFSDGRIDRVDSMGADDRYYVKIIDYKSGNKKFDMEDVMNGLQIQLIYYMGAVLDIEKERHKDSTVMPAGAFYFNVKSPYVERLYEDNTEELSGEERENLNRRYEELMLAEYKMSGLVNSDGEAVCNMDRSLQEGAKASAIIPIKSDEINIGMGKSSMGVINFTRLIEYVRNQTEKMCDEILDGNIQVNPYKKGSVTPCDYCSYRGLCTFNEKHSGNSFRTLNKFEPEDIYRSIGGDGDGSKVDR